MDISRNVPNLATMLKPVTGAGPSAAAQALATAKGAGQDAIRQLANPAPSLLYAGIPLSGALGNGDTGLGLLLEPGGFDIFNFAAKIEKMPPNRNPYNNWLTAEAKPIVDVVPERIGFYLGSMGDDAPPGLISALAENIFLELKLSNGTIISQPLNTIPGFNAIARRPATTADNTTIITEEFGVGSPAMMFKFPQAYLFPKDEVVQCILTCYNGLPSFISGLSGNFPPAGSTLGVIMQGAMQLRVQTAR